MRVLPLVLLLACLGCDDSTGPEDEGLVPGAYLIRFQVVAGAGVPAGLIGQHGLRVEVAQPATQPTQFALTNSILTAATTTSDYLNPAREGLALSPSQWRFQYRYRSDPTMGVRITVVEDGGAEGGRRIAFCGAIRGEVEFPGVDCVVEYREE